MGNPDNKKGETKMVPKFVLYLVLPLLFVSPALATQPYNGDNRNEANASATANGGNVYSNVKQDVNNTNITAVNTSLKTSQNQGQLQGQIQGQKQVSKQANEQNTNIGGDTNKVNSYAWAFSGGAEGTNSASFGGPLGGLGLNKTDKYKALISAIKAIESSEYLSKEEKEAMIKPLYKKMVKSIKTQRVVGVLWENEGSNILSILTWGSFWKD